jgi:hypothetical protein
MPASRPIRSLLLLLVLLAAPLLKAQNEGGVKVETCGASTSVSC